MFTNKPNSCLLKIRKNECRALLDAGAAVSLIRKKTSDNLLSRTKLFKNDIPSLQAVYGISLIAIGYVNITFNN